MDLALAMHDDCLRSVLHRHHGYEVGTYQANNAAFIAYSPVF